MMDDDIFVHISITLRICFEGFWETFCELLGRFEKNKFRDHT